MKFVLRTKEIRLWRVKSPLWGGYGVPSGQLEQFASRKEEMLRPAPEAGAGLLLQLGVTLPFSRP